MLVPELDWLTSREAENIWPFAHRLGVLDEEHKWLEELVKRARKEKGLLFLAGYLLGRAETGEQEWRDKLLDEWTQNEEDLSKAVLEATWRGDPSDSGAKRLAILVDKGWLEPQALSILMWGKWILGLGIRAFSELAERLMRDEGDLTTEAAMAILVQRLEVFPNEKDHLSNLSWSLIERENAIFGSTMGTYYWKEIACNYLQDDPVRISKIILTGFEKIESVILSDSECMEILREATKIDPEPVWNEVSGVLLRKDNTSLRLKLALDKWYVTLIDLNFLLNWARKNEPWGPKILASLSPLGGEPLDELPRELLIRYGDDKVVPYELMDNFQSGTFSGPMSSWLRGKIDVAKKWIDDEEPAVSKWAKELLESLKKQHEKIGLQEEEERW
ncbi:MAG: hypothetical protein DDT23_01154 [candidate division WS2 bacterium]|nr:hypothetical protein [Candidatus Lithacetigena glycinireducens]